MRSFRQNGALFFFVFGAALAAAGAAASCTATTRHSGFGDAGGASAQGGAGPGAGGAGGSTLSGLGGGFTTSSGAGGGTTMSSCKVIDDNGVPKQCDQKAPADAFSPVVAWTFDGPPADPAAFITGSFSTPLVANFTDDNGDGAIDLCDVPDVIVQTVQKFDFGGGGVVSIVASANMFMLAGDTGAQEFQFEGLVDGLVYPALGDINGDGFVEVLAADETAHLVAFDRTGKKIWTGDQGGYRATDSSGECTTIGIYDLDGDGNPEILFGWEVFNNKGQKLWGDPTNTTEFAGAYWCNSPTAADLDGDGKLEVLMGHETFRSDGTLYWKIPNFTPAHPHVANLDADPEPEVFLTNADGITVVEHDGTIKFGPVRPTAEPPAANCWGKPAVVHDFNGDAKADIAAATCQQYTAYSILGANITPMWSAPVQDLSGLATATAFDFLGSGSAQAIYADETQVWAFDGVTGQTAFTAPRKSGTLIEYPVVADIDNDGSADIAYVSNFTAGQKTAADHDITVMRDAMSRWIPARRIWNQYSYHVTNVREDGTIPKKQKNNWQNLNTFRTNSQISVGGDCNPIGPPN